LGEWAVFTILKDNNLSDLVAYGVFETLEELNTSIQSLPLHKDQYLITELIAPELNRDCNWTFVNIWEFTSAGGLEFKKQDYVSPSKVAQFEVQASTSLIPKIWLYLLPNLTPSQNCAFQASQLFDKCFLENRIQDSSGKSSNNLFCIEFLIGSSSMSMYPSNPKVFKVCLQSPHNLTSLPNGDYFTIETCNQLTTRLSYYSTVGNYSPKSIQIAYNYILDNFGLFGFEKDFGLTFDFRNRNWLNQYLGVHFKINKFIIKRNLSKTDQVYSLSDLQLSMSPSGLLYHLDYQDDQDPSIIVLLDPDTTEVDYDLIEAELNKHRSFLNFQDQKPNISNYSCAMVVKGKDGIIKPVRNKCLVESSLIRSRIKLSKSGIPYWIDNDNQIRIYQDLSYSKYSYWQLYSLVMKYSDEFV
jgi:hypothetical protein